MRSFEKGFCEHLILASDVLRDVNGLEASRQGGVQLLYADSTYHHQPRCGMNPKAVVERLEDLGNFCMLGGR